MTWYSSSAGLWSGDWWNSANALVLLADFQEHFPSEALALNNNNQVYYDILANAPGVYDYTNFLNGYYDDELWWALAFIKVYDVVGDATFLTTAANIFADAHAVYGQNNCSGGIW